jgi:two-component system cell cycle sensor histidine kinase/response regulator CckA
MATVLIADDEASIRTLMSRVLTSAGYQVLGAANGLEAAALFRSYTSSIDLVITDIVMPVMDGYELIRLIQHDRPDTKIICMTGYAQQGCPEGTTLLPKPFLPSQLRELVERMCHEPHP